MGSCDSSCEGAGRAAGFEQEPGECLSHPRATCVGHMRRGGEPRERVGRLEPVQTDRGGLQKPLKLKNQGGAAAAAASPVGQQRPRATLGPFRARHTPSEVYSPSLIPGRGTARVIGSLGRMKGRLSRGLEGYRAVQWVSQPFRLGQIGLAKGIAKGIAKGMATC